MKLKNHKNKGKNSRIEKHKLLVSGAPKKKCVKKSKLFDDVRSEERRPKRRSSLILAQCSDF